MPARSLPVVARFEVKLMRGLWWSSVLIGSLLGGIAGAALMFGLTQAFGGTAGSQPSLATAGSRLSATSAAAGTGGTAAARNGVDATGIYDQARPSVVTITTSTVSRRGRAQGEGSGIVLDTGGRILTNNHVVEGASRLQVTFSDGQSYAATVLATDPTNDLAVVQVPAPPGELHPATLGDATTLRVGQPVVAIGNPLGYEGSLTEGVISGLDRTFAHPSATTMDHLIQSDAAINPGNSGGPLLNAKGEVIGVNTLLDNADGTDSFSGIGFAVPISTAQKVIQQAGGGKA